jgi:hypothetical protein
VKNTRRNPKRPKSPAWGLIQETSLATDTRRMEQHRTFYGHLPWWPLATAAGLTTALVISATAGRVIDTVIITVLLVPTLAFLLVWLIFLAKGRFGGGRPS